jgi:polyisoprenyl-phosphate glycosyltransferase
VTDPATLGPLISVVVPIFNEEQVLPELHRRLRAALAEVPGDHEILYVNDGSTDGSAALVERWARAEDDVVLVDLSRNFGMEVAMSSGIDYASGRYVVLMHADLQDPPELIPRMFAAAKEEGADVVYARRIGRDESALKRTLATAFYGVMARLARVPYQGQAGDFRLMSHRVVETLKQMPERRRFLRGMVAWVGLKQIPIEYRRGGRTSGRGASYPELVKLALEAIASFSDVPLQLSTYAGIFTALVSAGGALVLLILTVADVITTTLELWILVSVLFLGGVQLTSVGILGRYLARVHDESLRRPLYVVSRIVSSTAARGSEPLPRPIERRW